ncbi:MAG TPA: hypothetical protein DCX54_07675, partial [Flavobacteriales bacterium]|nr:hypothetical protein [Flavobacteriales bacterium]
MNLNLLKNMRCNILTGSFLSFTLLIAVLLSSYSETKATHAMGMDLTYVQISQDTFLITLAFYRDCSGVAAPNSATLNLKSASCNKNINITLPRVGTGNETTPVCTSIITQCNGGSFPGSEEYIYKRLVVLPNRCTDWVISNQICCRNNGITTIFNPGNQNIYVEAKINNFNMNSSPKFSNNPVPFVCANQTYCFNNGAVDPEGDSLVYSLVTPRTNTGIGDTVRFLSGFSRTKPLTSSPNVTLNPNTGDLCMFPTDSNQIAILAILVKEYRNGVFVGSIMRDIQLRILGCPNGNSLPQLSGIDSSSFFSKKVCANSNLTFNIFSVDPDTTQTITMTWNQAIPGASFTFTPGPRPVATFSWTPNNSHIRTQPFCFTVEVADDNCPFNGLQVFSYCITVVGVKAIVDSIYDPVCPGACDGHATATVINGIPPFSYLWDDPSNQTNASAHNLCAGSYIVRGIDSTGCTTYDSILLIDPKEMRLSMDSMNVSCNGGSDGMAIASVTAFGTAPFYFNWDALTGSQVNDTASNLGAGIYSVNVVDSNNCQVSDTIEISEPPPIVGVMTVIANVSCNGNNDGEAAVAVSGGSPPYTYLWGSLSGSQTTDTAFNLIAGTHVVTITDNNGCQVMDSIVVTEPNTAINLALSKTDVSCKGDSSGSATVIASGGTPPYAYTWDAGTGNQTTATASNLPAGIYGVVVTDLNNCVAYPNIMITEPDTALTLVPVDSFVQCFGDANGIAGVLVTGGTNPYSYSWDASALNQTTAFASSLTVGTYTVLVTDSANCSDSVSVSILSASAPLTLTANIANVSCNNGSDGKAHVSISGGQPGYNIQWDSTSGFQNTDTAFSLRAGTHMVTVMDSFGCTIDTTLIVTEPAPLLSLTSIHQDALCKGDSSGWVTVLVAGGTPPYSYLWSASAGFQTTDTAKNL